MNLVKPLRVQASMVKKSAATITSRCLHRNSFQVVFPFPLRCRFQRVLLQNVGDGAAPDLMAQVGQRSLDSTVAPISILAGHTYHQPLNLILRTRPAWATSLAAIVLLGDQPAVPGQERCGVTIVLTS